MSKITTPRSVILPIEVRTMLPASKLIKKTLTLTYTPLDGGAPHNLEIKQVQRANPVE